MSNFLYNNNWLDYKYRAKSDGRYVTFRIALNLMKQRGGKFIVETGTTRMADDWGAGMSTVIFADFLKKEVTDGYLSTVDISEDNIKVCQTVTAEFSGVIEYAVQDSVEFLKEFPFVIDLLYLDSMDYPLTPQEGPVEDCQKHQLNEYLAAKNKLSNRAIILLDDNDLPGGGKCKLTKEKLLEEGWELILDTQQSLFQRA